jgi:alpha-N-arabinofuranosidase
LDLLQPEHFITVDIMKFGGVRCNSCISFLLLVSTVPLLAAETAHLSIDASKAGTKIDRNLFGQFAENLGHGLYEGIWVGPDSAIPNTRGIRNDVVTALRALKVPNVRWPGGCFGDEYHWRKGVGPAAQRPATLNSSWGGVVDTNSFGTDEFMDFVQQIGSQAYVSINVGSGSPQEAAEWLEYMTAAKPTAFGQGTGRLRTSRSLPGPLPWHWKRELGLWRQHERGLLPEPAQNLQPLR